METQEIKTVIRDITPELAKQILGKNGINRRPSQKKIEAYYREMLNGKWMLTGQGISISRTGRLLDGQNRLHAIIKYGKGVEMIIMYGFDDETFKVYDTGKTRSAGDIFYISGISNANNIAGGIRNYLLRLNYDDKTATSKGGKPAIAGYYISNQDVLDEYLKNPDSWQESCKVAEKCYSKFRLMSVTKIIGLIGYLTLNKLYGTDFVSQFFYEINGVIDPSCNSTRLLREALSRDKMAFKRMDDLSRAAFLNKAWNHYVKKSDLKILKFDRERDSFPELI